MPPLPHLDRDDRRQLLHSARIAVGTALHVLARADALSVVQAREQLREAMARLDELLAAEDLVEGN